MCMWEDDFLQTVGILFIKSVTYFVNFFLNFEFKIFYFNNFEQVFAYVSHSLNKKSEI